MGFEVGNLSSEATSLPLIAPLLPIWFLHLFQTCLSIFYPLGSALNLFQISSPFRSVHLIDLLAILIFGLLTLKRKREIIKSCTYLI